MTANSIYLRTPGASIPCGYALGFSVYTARKLIPPLHGGYITWWKLQICKEDVARFVVQSDVLLFIFQGGQKGIATQVGTVGIVLNRHQPALFCCPINRLTETRVSSVANIMTACNFLCLSDTVPVINFSLWESFCFSFIILFNPVVLLGLVESFKVKQKITKTHWWFTSKNTSTQACPPHPHFCKAVLSVLQSHWINKCTPEYWSTDTPIAITELLSLSQDENR